MQKKIIIIFLVLSIIVAICFCFLRLKDKQITSDKAYKIAMNQVGKSEQEIISKTIKKNDNKKIYEITFNDEEYSYKFEINMQSGDILKQDKKQYIDEEQVKKIALESANLKEKDVVMMTVYLENRNDVMTYIVTFYHKNQKYAYEINALTGEFINNNIERN